MLGALSLSADQRQSLFRRVMKEILVPTGIGLAVWALLAALFWDEANLRKHLIPFALAVDLSIGLQFVFEFRALFSTDGKHRSVIGEWCEETWTRLKFVFGPTRCEEPTHGC